MNKPENATSRVKVPPTLLKRLKVLAAKRGVPMWQLIKLEVFDKWE